LPDELPGSPLFRDVVTGYFNPAFVPASVRPDYDLVVLCRKQYYSLDERGYPTGLAEKDRTVNYLVGLGVFSRGARLLETSQVTCLDGLEDVRLHEFRNETFLIGNQPVVTGDSIANLPIIGKLTYSDKGIEVQQHSLRRTHIMWKSLFLRIAAICVYGNIPG
jgi:hypothetical protein